ncbi:MAG: hypothetical protein ABIE70_01415 [bacterium]
MADSEKKKAAQSRIASDQRFRYIGFEVYPGKPKDLFKSEAEKNKLVESVKAKRESGEVVRDECKLMEERVSGMDKIVMSLACLVMLFSLFLPWFSVYNEVEAKVAAKPEPLAAVADSGSQFTDSVAALTADSLTMVAATESEPVTAEAGQDTTQAGGGATVAGESRAEEVLHGYVAKKKFTKTYERLSGPGSLISLGSVGSYVFSSGIVVILTALLLLLMVLMTLLLPLYTLYGLYGLKGDSDKKALELKRIVRLNWLPLVTFTAALILSFLGANYGFDSQAIFTSLGDSYSVGAFMNMLSWGVFVSIAMSILLAAKGSEI